MSHTLTSIGTHGLSTVSPAPSGDGGQALNVLFSAIDTALSTLSTSVATKASQSSLDSLGTTVSAQGTSITSLGTSVAGKASQSSVDALSTTVAAHTTSLTSQTLERQSTTGGGDE